MVSQTAARQLKWLSQRDDECVKKAIKEHIAGAANDTYERFALRPKADILNKNVFDGLIRNMVGESIKETPDEPKSS